MSGDRLCRKHLNNRKAETVLRLFRFFQKVPI